MEGSVFMPFDYLFRPIQIGSVNIKNRFVMSPLGTRYPNKDHTVSQRMIEHYARRARGGFGLIILEFTAVTAGGRTQANQLGIWDDSFIPGHRRLVEAVHEGGAKIFLQLTHGGRQVKGGFDGQADLVSSSAIPCEPCGVLPRAMTLEEIARLIDDFGAAAARAKEAGYDAVEIHGANGYLVNQFLSAAVNKRTDAYGGSLANRARLLLELIRRVHAVCGEGYPVTVRINGDDHMEDGLTPDEAAVICAMAEEAGAAAVNTSASMYPSSQWLALPANAPMGHNSYITETIKRAVSIPVILTGRLNDPYVSEYLLRTGKADLAAMGRAALAEPDFPNKTAAGRLDEICPCISCNQGCQAAASNPKTGYVSCAVNPFVGFESELEVKPAEMKKRVVVVGSGPIGMLAAWITARRGHHVTVVERAEQVGGQFRLAMIPPGKQQLARVIQYYETMCKKAGVHFLLNTNATVETVQGLHPDAVLLATGAEPLIPRSIPGAGRPGFVTHVEVLSGRIPMAGKKVLMAGGGEVAIETAEFMAEHDASVTVVEMADAIAATMPAGNRKHMLRRIEAKGIQVFVKSPIQEFLEDGVICEQDGRLIELRGFDLVVLSLGRKSCRQLEEPLKKIVPEVYVIGDAKTPGAIFAGNAHAVRAALSL